MSNPWGRGRTATQPLALILNVLWWRAKCSRQGFVQEDWFSPAYMPPCFCESLPDALPFLYLLASTDLPRNFTAYVVTITSNRKAWTIITYLASASTILPLLHLTNHLVLCKGQETGSWNRTNSGNCVTTLYCKSVVPTVPFKFAIIEYPVGYLFS